MSETLTYILRMLAVNMNRPLDFDTLTSQMEGAYSSREVRSAVWYGVAHGVLDFTPEWRVVPVAPLPEPR